MPVMRVRGNQFLIFTFIYEFLLHFDEIYRECTDAEKKKFIQSFVDRIELYPERRKDGNIGLRTRRQIRKMIVRTNRFLSACGNS